MLLVTRNFAPTSHVSVERATKLAKYLPEFGWRPTVLTGARATVGLAQDPGLLDQVGGVEVIRSWAPEFSWFYKGMAKGTNTPLKQRGAPRRGILHPKSWMIPDSQALWRLFAVRAALRRARDVRWDAVLATSFPPTTILIAHAIATRLRIPYVADFRDSWTRFHNAPQRPALLAKFEQRLELKMIRGAAAVVTVQTSFVEHAMARIAATERPPLYLIRNGYDEDDFLQAEPVELPRFSIVHTGQLRRSPHPLWEALAHAMQERPELRGRLHVWQVGFVDARAIPILEAAPEGVTVHHVPWVSQRKSIGYMLAADLLWVEEFQGIMPSKTMQYLRASRPILAFLDEGRDICDVLQAADEAYVVRRSEARGAGSLIAAVALRPRAPLGEPSPAIAAYSRREIARRFAAVLDAACGKHVRPAGALSPVRLTSARNAST